MKKVFLIFVLNFTSLYLLFFKIVLEKNEFDGNTSSILGEPLKISIVKTIDENINYKDLYIKDEHITDVIKNKFQWSKDDKV